jgi:hypothetical protein
MHLPSTSRRRIDALALALLLLVLCWVIDLRILGQPLLAEGRPLFDNPHLLRSLLLALAAATLVWGFAVPDQAAGASGDWPRTPTPATWPGPGRLLLAALVIDLLFVALFLISPQYYYKASREDRPIEDASAMLLFAAAALMALSAWRLHRSKPQHGAWLVRGAVALAVAFLIIGMEEISWGQRIFGIRSPEVFLEHNLQRETNLHNFVTDEAENAYYLGAFLLLTAWPFFVPRTPALARQPLFAFFTPSEPLMVAAALSAAFSYDLWNVSFTQFAFFCTVCILLATAWQRRHSNRSLARWALLMAVVCVVTQAAHLALGYRTVRLWDVSEYKEFLVPFFLAAYAVEILQRSGGEPGSRRL